MMAGLKVVGPVAIACYFFVFAIFDPRSTEQLPTAVLSTLLFGTMWFGIPWVAIGLGLFIAMARSMRFRDFVMQMSPFVVITLAVIASGSGYVFGRIVSALIGPAAF